MKHLLLLCFATLQLCMSTNAWSWPGVDEYLTNVDIVSECYVLTATSDANDAGEDENKAGESSEEEEPDCD